MVVDPVPGVHFGVAVLDFASLYPSIIKTWNLGYETILCGHTDCRTNKIPDTEHWVCRDRKSTRLNSSHRCISYAVFCLKKNTKNRTLRTNTNKHNTAPEIST